MAKTSGNVSVEGETNESSGSGGAKAGTGEHESGSSEKPDPLQSNPKSTEPGTTESAKDTKDSRDSKSEPKDSDDKSKTEKKPVVTWERTIEIVKLVATVWVALLGSYVTMQFNERQHELNRIEAIAQMLPHIGGSGAAKGAKGGTGGDKGDEMSRDGAMWAIFRTANNHTMLRDLAALFPQDIYHVVSSIANSGELDKDPDALCALEVASEKLATLYTADPQKTELASRLYDQALRLRQRKPDDTSPLRVVDLSSAQVVTSQPTGDALAKLVRAVNDLADVHLKENIAASSTEKTKKKQGDQHFEAKELYLRARKLGIASDDQQVQEEVIRSDLSLATIYLSEKLSDDTFQYLKEAMELESKITRKPASLKDLDKDGNGYAGLDELAAGVDQAKARLKQILIDFPDKGAELG